MVGYTAICQNERTNQKHVTASAFTDSVPAWLRRLDDWCSRRADLKAAEKSAYSNDVYYFTPVPCGAGVFIAVCLRYDIC